MGDLATREEIRQRQAEDLRHALDQTLSAVPHDNNPAADTVAVEDEGRAVTVYRARLAGEVRGVAFNWVSEAGYGGPITLTVGIGRDGRIASVRVLSAQRDAGPGRQDRRAQVGLDPRLRRPRPGHRHTLGGALGRRRIRPVRRRHHHPRAVVKAVHASLKFFAGNPRACRRAGWPGGDSAR